MSQRQSDISRGGARTWFLRPRWIFVIAFLSRIGVAGVFLAHNKLSWGVNEPSAIAQAIVQGHGFSSVFHDASEPTAWLAPAYPTLLALVFLFFGIKTSASAVVAVLLNVIFSSLTAIVLVQLGREQFGENAGIIAGWAWAMALPLLFIPWLLWETCLSALVLAFAVMTLLRLSEASKAPNWIWCGAVWGFAALLNPAILAPLPALAIEAGFHSRRWKGPCLMMFVCLLAIVPWTARNYRALGRIVPVRSNFWPEAYFGNVDFSVHPTGNTMLYQREGEVAFAQDLKVRTLQFVRSNPRAFARLTSERMAAFWLRPTQLQPYPLMLFLLSLAGLLQAWRRGKRWAAFTFAMLFYPLIYYITYTFARYRHPIEPLMYLLAVFFLSDLFSSKKATRAEGVPGHCEVH
jgi:hypothetical protein